MLPFSPFPLIVIIVLVTLLFTFIQMGILTFAFEKLGLSPHSAMTLLLTSLIGSLINLPLYSVKTEHREHPMPSRLYQGMLRPHLKPFTDRTLIAVNVGGAVVPVFMSIFLIQHSHLDLATVFVAIAIVSAISYSVSRPVPGVGIGMPIFIAPVSAAVVAVLLGNSESAPLAYICGTLGVLIGADLFRLPHIQALGAPVASIGGAGTFDGIFLTGIVAVLLA